LKVKELKEKLLLQAFLSYPLAKFGSGICTQLSVLGVELIEGKENVVFVK
jgi:hypothetical protein